MSKTEIKNSVKKYESSLLANPKYSSNWISIAAKILGEFDDVVSLTSLTDFDAEQLEVIYDLEKYIRDNLSSFTDSGYSLRTRFSSSYNATQLRLILTSYVKNVPTEIIDLFISPDIPYAKSNYLIQAYIDGTDMREYIDFDHEQIYELYAGIINGVNITVYDKKDIPAEKMGVIRHALEVGYTAVYDRENKKITIV